MKVEGFRRRRGVVRLGLLTFVLVVAAAVWLRRAPNVALGRPATASSAGFTTAPGGAVDGVRYGWLGFHSGTAGTEWWSVDLGRPFDLERVRAYGRADCCFGQSIPLTLEVSLDGKTYREVARRTEEFSQFDPWVIQPKNAVARHVRFRTLRPTYLVLGEVEIHGRPL